jgi:hypothetical protein
MLPTTMTPFCSPKDLAQISIEKSISVLEFEDSYFSIVEFRPKHPLRVSCTRSSGLLPPKTRRGLGMPLGAFRSGHSRAMVTIFGKRPTNLLRACEPCNE